MPIEDKAQSYIVDEVFDEIEAVWSRLLMQAPHVQGHIRG